MVLEVSNEKNILSFPPYVTKLFQNSQMVWRNGFILTRPALEKLTMEVP